MDYVFELLIGLGFSVGLFLGYLGARTVFRALIPHSSSRRITLVLVAMGAVAAVPVALVLAFVLGGNSGGGVGSLISESVHLGSSGAPLGVSAGIALVLGAGVTLGAAVGGGIALLVSATLRGKLAA